MTTEVERKTGTIYEEWARAYVASRIENKEPMGIQEFAEIHPELPPDPRWYTWVKPQ